MNPLKWIATAFRKWVLRQSWCWPNCALCEVNRRQEAHYDACEACQGPGYPCAAMEGLNEEEQVVLRVLIPDDLPRSASSMPVIVFPPWQWPK